MRLCCSVPELPFLRLALFVAMVIGNISLNSGSSVQQQPEITCIHDQIAESNPYEVSLANQNEAASKRQASEDYSSIRIHPVFVNITPTFQSFIEAPDGPLFNSIKTLSSILMVHPVQGNLVIPPICRGREITSGPNEGKCRSPLPSQDRYRCGVFGIIPTEYIGTREVCETSFSQGGCRQEGPGGAGIPNADYLLFVSASSTGNCNGGTLAFASTCMVDVSNNNRPVAGYINICPSAIPRFSESILYGIFMHEIIHALGFSRTLFDRYINEDGIRYNPVRSQSGPYRGQNVFTGPKTAELAKEYYGCDKIDGLLLENQGGAGTASSHWERRTLHHSLMNGFISRDYLVLSKFTIALFEDSGWYKGNYTALEMLDQLPLQWGKGLGCSFLNERCTSETVYPYLCNRNGQQSICTYDHLSKGTCGNWNGFDGCLVAVAANSEDYCRTDVNTTTGADIERYGSNSICVDAAMSTSTSCGTYIKPDTPLPLCVSQATYAVNNSSQYVLQLQNESYSCEDDHAIITGNWSISCPPTDVVVSRTTTTLDELPTLSSGAITELSNDIYELVDDYINVPETDLVAFGGINRLAFSFATYFVNSLGNNNTVSVCSIFRFIETSPAEITNDRPFISGNGLNIYSARKNQVVASVVVESRDYSLTLMIDPTANHSFVYYAASVDFVGDYLQSIHSNDESFFGIIALADNTVVRVALSKTVSIAEVIFTSGAEHSMTIVTHGEEHKTTLNLGDTLRIYSNEDLTGSRLTANRAASFYSGHDCVSGRRTNCSILMEQIPPYNSWGNVFALHTNINGLRGNMFKIIASDVGANVMTNCTTNGTDYEVNNFNLGFRQHIVISVIHDYCVVDSDENILVIQFKDSGQKLHDTFMTILPALSHFQTKHVVQTYNSFPRHDYYVVLSVENTDPNTESLLLNDSPFTSEWKLVEINGNNYYYTTLSLSFFTRQSLQFSNNDIKFGAVLYGVRQRENRFETLAQPAGLALDIDETLPIQTPSPVQDVVTTLVDGMVNVTWSPPAIPNGVIYQYIVQRINSSGTFTYYVPANQHHILLSYINDALVFVSAVNIFGQSEFERAKSAVPCLPSHCINNGTCIAANSTRRQLTCNCIGVYSGTYCETGDKLYPFGSLEGDERISISGSVPRTTLAALNYSYFFYDLVTDMIYIYEDGIISLGNRYFYGRSFPMPLSNLSQHVIAPFWADVDFKNIGNIFYRQTSEPSLLARATREVRSTFPTSSNTTIKNLLIVTWDGVPFRRITSSKDLRNLTVNTFQCVLATNEFESFVLFLYPDDGIEWTTGDISGGTDGFGGDEAVAGISAGDGVNFITIPGSLTPSIININNTSNVGTPGVWIFKVGTVNVSIINETPGIFGGENNSFAYFFGSQLSLTCLITSTPVANSEFKWRCSTGCLNGVKVGQTINLTVQQGGAIFCAYTVDGIEYSSDPIEISIPITDFVPSISLEPAAFTVGRQQAIVCTVNLIPGEEVNNSVLITWVAPDGVNISDERFIIMPTTINGSSFISTLQFDYLAESDVGTYYCDIVSNRSAFTLPVDLQDFRIQPPSVRVTAPVIQNFGQPLTLTCVVTSVRGITSGTAITWLSLGDEVRRVDDITGNVLGTSVSYRDQLNISSLISEGLYSCRFIINSTMQVSNQYTIRLELTSPNEAPRNFRNISGTSTTITFQWDRLFLFQRNRRITQYVITCSRLDGESIFTVNVTSSDTTGTAVGLRPFTYYNCSVYAVTEYGGPSSPSLLVQTAEAVSSAPVITSVTAIDSYSVHVIWTAPTQPNGIITDYTITYSIGNIVNTTNVSSSGETIQSFNITGLSPYQMVTVTITANNSAGRSNASNQVSTRTRELDFIPSISLDPVMHTVGQQQIIACTATLIPGEDVNNSLVFTWLAPDGVNINDERVTFMPTVVNGTNHTSILHFEYLMESDVGAYQCNITSNRSSIPQSVELGDLLIPNPRVNLTAPAILRLTCDVTTVRGITSGLTIIWSEFEVEVSRVQNAVGNVVGNSASYTHQLILLPLTHDSNFSCRAIINSTSQPQDVAFIRVELTSPNAAPRNFNNISRTSTTITFQWEALQLSQSNSDITWYVITCATLRDLNSTMVNISGNDTTGTVTDLRPFTSYDCSVHAVTKYGGPSSDIITVETTEGVPSAPVITAVTAVDSQSVLVTWRAPAEPNGIIIGYTITYNTGGSFSTINITFNGEMTQSLNISGLSTYQLVAVTVTAVNRAGRSSPSNQVSNRTMELAPGVVQFQVNDLTATGETGVSWSPPLQPNGVITSYQVVYSVYESSAIVRSEMLSNSTITYIIKNLDPGTPYQVTVVAFTSAGRGATNDYIIFFSEELMPGTLPTDVSYTQLNNASISVTWNPLSLFEARGFPSYQAILTEGPANRDATSRSHVITIATNNSFAIFTDLNSSQQYTVLVGVATGSNRSAFVYSNPLTVPRLTTPGNSGATNVAVGRTLRIILIIATVVVIIF